jgi:single-strand DNA-binding protein
MASVNKVIIVGNLGKDPELRYNPSGAAWCTVSIATNRKWKDKQDEQQEETEWHRVVFNGRLAEIAGEYLKAGSVAYVEGRLKTRKWADKEGVERYVTEVIAESMQMFGQREGGAPRDAAPAPRPAAKTHGDRAGGPKNRPPQPSTGFDDMDDDIPF